MASQIHEYPLNVAWTGGRGGSGTITPLASGFEIPIAVPPEFQGPGGATNPEELLTSAIAGCYSITFGIIAANRRLPIVSVRTEALGEVEQDGANFAYKRVTLRPTITLASGATDQQVAQTTEFAHKADLYCIVTNAVRGKVEVTIEPTVIIA
ncbi:SACOL1771 family peroxiredoxin [soil metagenome]